MYIITENLNLVQTRNLHLIVNNKHTVESILKVPNCFAFSYFSNNWYILVHANPNNGIYSCVEVFEVCKKCIYQLTNILQLEDGDSPRNMKLLDVNRVVVMTNSG